MQLETIRVIRLAFVVSGVLIVVGIVGGVVVLVFKVFWFLSFRFECVDQSLVVEVLAWKFTSQEVPVLLDVLAAVVEQDRDISFSERCWLCGRDLHCLGGLLCLR